MNKLSFIAMVAMFAIVGCSKSEFGSDSDALPSKSPTPDCPSGGPAGVATLAELKPETVFSNIVTASGGNVGKARFEFTFAGVKPELIEAHDFNVDFKVHSTDFTNIQISVGQPVVSKVHCSLRDLTLTLNMDYKSGADKVAINYQGQQFEFTFKVKADGTVPSKIMNSDIFLYDKTDPRFQNLPAGSSPTPDKVCKGTDGYPCANSAG